MRALTGAARAAAVTALAVAVLMVAAAVLPGCTSTPTVLPSRDFDRPTDMAFLCMGIFDPDGDGDAAAQLSGRPMRDCHPSEKFDPAPDAAHQSFAFVPSSGTGELSVINADAWKLVDLDPTVGGYNQAPLGVFPEQISASDDGCRLVTANRGSCDFTLVDPAALIGPRVGLPCTDPDPIKCREKVTETVRVTTGTGAVLQVAPHDIFFLPQNIAGMTDGAKLCPSSGATEAMLTTDRVPWRALATFPSCDLIATLDLPSGRIVDSVYVRVDGNSVRFEPAGQNPVCPVDCGARTPPVLPDAGSETSGGGGAGGGGTDADVDGAGADALDDAGGAGGAGGAAGAGGAGGAPTTPAETPTFGPGALRPGSIALAPVEAGTTNTRAYVGLASGPFVMALDVSLTGMLAASSEGAAIFLHEGARGATRVRLSVSPWETPTNPEFTGAFLTPLDPPDANRRYMFVIARDGTVRVVNVPTVGPPVECETNIDPQNLPDGIADEADANGRNCIPVDRAHRRPFALGPGIRLPSVPIDVAAADIRVNPPDTPIGQCVTTGLCDGTVRETTVSGTYAWILTANGSIFLLNIDPVLRSIFVFDPDVATPIPNTPVLSPEAQPQIGGLRDRNVLTYSRALDPSSGPPRIDNLPVPLQTGPRFEEVWTRGTENNAAAINNAYIQTDVFFPDRRAVNPQVWSVGWEAPLSGARVSGNLLPSGGLTSELLDGGVNFCGLGVLKDDLVTLVGCTSNGDCGFGKICVRGTAGTQGAGGLPINGLCIDPAFEARATTQCANLLNTVRRYEVTIAETNKLTFRPHRDELVRSLLTPCVPGADRATDGGAGSGGGADGGTGGADGGATAINSCADPNDSTTSRFACVEDPDALGSMVYRCLQPCDVPGTTDGCRIGRICVDYEGQGTFCADGPRIDAKNCFPQLTTYQVNAGRSFIVAGAQTGVPATGVAGPGGTCRRRPESELDSRLVARIAVDGPNAEICDNVPANSLDSRCNPNTDPPPTGDPPPPPRCKAEADALLDILKRVPVPNPCLFLGGPNSSVPATQSPQRVHALFRNTELAFMLTNLDRAPTTPLNLQLDVHGGFRPQAVINVSTVEVSMPSRILLGPFDSKGGTPGDLNEFEAPYLFVVDQRRLGRSQGGGPTRGQILRINPLFGVPGGGLQPIYEDLARSGNLFPIQ